jgi:Glycosyl transferase family 2
MNNNLKLHEYISFLNSLDLKINIVDIIEVRENLGDCLADWMEVKSIICRSDKKEIYDIDIRFAWDSKVFKQHLYDYGWNQSILLHSNDNKHQSRLKLIIYLCHPSTGLFDRIQTREVPNEFIIGSYWKSIHHCYLALPFQHPFDLPELLDLDNEITKHSCLDNSSLLSVARNASSIVDGGLRTKGINKAGTSDRPLISVITIVFNGEDKLEQTIQSVINQNHNNFEYIIIDGASTDKTLDIIKKYDSLIDYWISEKDRGIYDAMNKGIELANGQWLNFMNCADLFYSYQSLSSVPLKAEIDFYYSDSILYGENKSVRIYNCSQKNKIFIHQSIVYKKDTHEKYKYLVHENLTISDYFFFRRNDSKNWLKLDTPLSIYNTEGISSTSLTHATQKLFVDFIAGDFSGLEMSFRIVINYIKSLVKQVTGSILRKR